LGSINFVCNIDNNIVVAARSSLYFFNYNIINDEISIISQENKFSIDSISDIYCFDNITNPISHLPASEG